VATAEKPLAWHRFRGCDIRMWRDADHVVRFTVGDIFKALGLNAGDYVALTPRDTHYSYDDLSIVLRHREDEVTQALFTFLRHELAEYDRGIYGPVEVPAAPAPRQDLITVAAAAARIGDSLGRVHTSRDLWAYLVDQDWVTKTDAGRWIPNPEQLAAGHLDILDVPIHGRRDLYPQIHLTSDGLATLTKQHLAQEAHA
jgi:hypothetical protein